MSPGPSAPQLADGVADGLHLVARLCGRAAVGLGGGLGERPVPHLDGIGTAGDLDDRAQAASGRRRNAG